MKEPVVRPDYDRLWQQYRSYPSKKNRDLLITSCEGLICSIQNRWFWGVDAATAEDLVQEGYMGLIDVLDNYDPIQHPDVKFSTYVSHIISGRMRHYLRDKAYELRMPAWAHDLSGLIKRVQHLFFVINKRMAHNDSELADFVGCNIESLIEARKATHKDARVSYDQPYCEGDDEEPILEYLQTGEEVVRKIDTIKTSLSDEKLEAFYQLLERLPEFHRLVLMNYFSGKMSQSEIALETGYSQNYICNIIKMSLRRFRKVLGITPTTDNSSTEKVTPVSSKEFADAATALLNEYKSELKCSRSRQNGDPTRAATPHTTKEAVKTSDVQIAPLNEEVKKAVINRFIEAISDLERYIDELKKEENRILNQLEKMRPIDTSPLVATDKVEAIKAPVLS